MDHEAVLLQRLRDVRALLVENDVEGILVGNGHNRRWLSGFEGSYGWLMVTAEKALLGTDFRYWEQALTQAPYYELFKITKECTQNDLIFAGQVHDIALEAQSVSIREFKNLQQLTDINWVLCDDLVERLRAVKDESELKRIRTAAAITDAAMAAVKNLARIGMTEAALAWELEKHMREEGADGLAFPLHVASGPNSALPHHASSERPIQPGEILLIDMGASFNGYASDLTRTFYVGTQADQRFRELYAIVQEAHDQAIAAIQPGVRGREVDAVARDIIGEAGHGDHFGHGLGHGLGLQAHEEPRLSPSKAETPLVSGMLATVEPGIYLPGYGGIRIEDLVLVTGNGAEFLSHCSTEPLLELD